MANDTPKRLAKFQLILFFGISVFAHVYAAPPLSPGASSPGAGASSSVRSISSPAKQDGNVQQPASPTLAAMSPSPAAAQTSAHSDAGSVSADKIYTMVVSTLALFLSGSLAIYTLFKDRKARAQSISDDYWLRKVVSPLAIEPLIKSMLETISAVPPDCCEPHFLPDALDRFMAKYQQDHRIQSTNLIAFGLLSPKLYDPASKAFDEVEDAVITYCNVNRNGQKTAAGDAVETRDKLAERIRSQLNAILQLVREYQSSLK